MSKSVPGQKSSFSETPPERLPFDEIIRRVNKRFDNAIVETAGNDRYRYFTTAWRERLGHSLGFFSIATSMLQMRRRNAEILEFGVPIVRNDASMPISKLDKDVGAEFFLLSYMAARGGEKTLQVTRDVYEERFLSRHRPPVSELGRKLLEFDSVPMLEIKPDPKMAPEDGLTE